MNIAEITSWIYQCESVLLRVQKKIEKLGSESCSNEILIVKTYFYDIADKISKAAKDAILSFSEGDDARIMLLGLKRFTRTETFNPKIARQLIAQELISEGKYCF